MKRVVATLFSCLAAAGCGLLSERDTDVESIFNGRDLSGWVVENEAAFSVRDGVIFVDGGTGWLRSVQEYGDFVFRLDFRFLEPGANSGIFVRTAATSKDDENGWPDNGYQVQCMDTLEGPRHVAAMIPYGGEGMDEDDFESDIEKIRAVYRPQGEWNTYEITCIGEELEVKLNGAVVTRAWNLGNDRGHVGIQAEHGRLEYRHLGVRELP